MSISQRLGAVVVALVAVAFKRAPGLIRFFSPVMRRLLVTRLPVGPNALLRAANDEQEMARAALPLG
jgi:hypothetical protein